MSEFKGTKGKFSDGYTGWRIDNRETNGVQGFEIHYSDDGECITDHVYTKEDAVLISKAPEMLEMLKDIIESADAISDLDSSGRTEIYYQYIRKAEKLIKEVTNI